MNWMSLDIIVRFLSTEPASLFSAEAETGWPAAKEPSREPLLNPEMERIRSL
jgi:hypothetical protein